MTISGILSKPEATNMFTPGTDRANRIEYVRDPARFAAISDKTPDPGPAGLSRPGCRCRRARCRRAGRPFSTFPNRHFEYALTWYGLALAALTMLGSWLFARRQGLNACAPHPPSPLV